MHWFERPDHVNIHDLAQSTEQLVLENSKTISIVLLSLNSTYAIDLNK